MFKPRIKARLRKNKQIIGKNIDGIAILTGGKGRIKLGLNLFKDYSNIKLIMLVNFYFFF